ncbi:hypothetical protein SEVCU071_0484 [Staphylococcus epidermidis VCU071]|jgi:conserved hypothetical protein|uniref:DUF2075 domain-containing protein n=1 Tax=Staphylococcus epidermidis TaxID=1282 RepID=UPI0002432DDB|nr:DUF2075 domain-containing protein [Staphylococcus epidermidis]EHM69622.1 hypothetical protein SEVCU071_0484 [Staphylococcus epidermidis VCU071]MBE0334016.1 DUF2075 domain-containing protein [Staphylococcus epidermidis]MBM0778231.1 DUF2075 domain-containing protein [Staphylococcus epidermidis]MCG2136730.1 DUF2075 domain-containing protein [Staphylococcus epidermidis]MCG7816631.1 DUF2075 domain-containing protein [Staphylococcus epidermidis]
MGNLLKIENINYSLENLDNSVRKWNTSTNGKFLLRYPTVYIINDKKSENNFEVYVGETADIRNRTRQHLNADTKVKSFWEDFSESKKSSMYVIGHELFNKSLTLDIENRLMQYLLSVENISRVHNSRTNQQNEYYTSEMLDEIFSEIWQSLNKKNKSLFPIESIIKDSAIFKASPFHKLTQEQINAKEEILTKIKESILLNEDGQLIIVEGEAGSGKTVLMSTLLYELGKYNLDLDENLDIHLLVNHNEHVSIYSQIASKLGIANKKNKIVQKPTSFINNNLSDEKVDVVIVDEAHLLLTQGKQSYQGKNHLDDLLARAKVVVIVFDIKQVLTTEQIWEVDKLNEYFDKAKSNSNHVTLRNQMRINSDISTVNWIRNLVDYQVINSIPKDKLGYDIKIFDTPDELEKAIKIKATHTDSGISRMLATFDWKYGTKPPNNEDFWRVKIGNWSMPWNYQLKANRNQASLPWVEQDQTIDEIGSTFTIQGLDLNFAGVIIGPSVKYRDGKIIFDKSESANKKATQRRTLKDGSKQYFSEMLLKNELNVLLTRGVNGLYIYAVDDQLREALKIAAKDESNG